MKLPLSWYQLVKCNKRSDMTRCSALFLRSIENREKLLFGYLSEKEKEETSEFSCKKRRLEFMAGRITAKFCASRLLDVMPDRINLAKNRWGRPILSIDGNICSDISIAISHGGRYVYCAAVLGGQVGLDVEPISSKPFELHELWTHPEEFRQLHSSRKSIKQRDREFTQLWSAKESLAKYLNKDLEAIFEHAVLLTNTLDRMVLQYGEGAERLTCTCRTVLHREHVFTYLDSL